MNADQSGRSGSIEPAPDAAVGSAAQDDPRGESIGEMAADAAPSAPPGTVTDAAAAVVALEQEVAELQDQLLRAVAEVENVRRRARDEVERARKFSIETFAESLLPVKDSLELALAVEAPSIENVKEGVGATLQLFRSVFEKNRLVEIDPAGEKFDPNLHQAISTVPAAGLQPAVAPGHVAHVLQKGYLIADRVLRPALVTVVQDRTS